MRTLKSVVLIGLALLLPLRSKAQVAIGEATLDTPVGELYVPDVSLTTALSRLGYSVKANGYVLFGTEVVLTEAGEQPHVNLTLYRNDTVRTALDSVMRQLPNYRWEMVSEHLVHIFPIQPAKNDFLNMIVPQFDIRDEYPPNIFTNLPLFIPEILRAIVSENSPPGGASGYGASYASTEGPRINLSFKNLKVREILNGVVEEMIRTLPASHPPFGWTYAIRPTPESIAGRMHSWNAHRSVLESSWRAVAAAR